MSRRISQSECAEIGNVGRFAQIKFEKDENVPGGAYLVGLSEAGFDVNYILTGRPGALDDAEAALLLAYRKASAAQREKVMEVLR